MFKFLKSFMNNKPYFNNNESKHRILNTNYMEEPSEVEDSIFFGCGCFWGAEKCFWKLPGVTTTSVGYAGGEMLNPTYNDVCSGYTGHAEVVKVVWNTAKIDISDLLKMFWECHDPTQKNGQGNDIGSQYKSAIYFINSKNEKIINNSRKAYQELLFNNNFGLIQTEIKKIKEYFYAENYHQQYLSIKGSRQYCSASPTNIKLEGFTGANYKLEKKLWDNFDWQIKHCVLRANNDPL